MHGITLTTYKKKPLDTRYLGNLFAKHNTYLLTYLRKIILFYGFKNSLYLPSKKPTKTGTNIKRILVKL